MIDSPKVVQSPRQPTAVIHLTIPAAEMGTVMGPAYNELAETVKAQGIKTTGPWFSRHFHQPGETWDFELGFPVESPVTPAGRVTNSELPAATVARAVYHGGYEHLADGWAELDAWVNSAGHTPRGDLWEFYSVGPEEGDDASKYRTELNRPLTNT